MHTQLQVASPLAGVPARAILTPTARSTRFKTVGSPPGSNSDRASSRRAAPHAHRATSSPSPRPSYMTSLESTQARVVSRWRRPRANRRLTAPRNKTIQPSRASTASTASSLTSSPSQPSPTQRPSIAINMPSTDLPADPPRTGSTNEFICLFFLADDKQTKQLPLRQRKLCRIDR